VDGQLHGVRLSRGRTRRPIAATPRYEGGRATEPRASVDGNVPKRADSLRSGRVRVHGAPRATTDIDLLLTRSSLAGAVEVARTCGFRIAALLMTFLRPLVGTFRPPHPGESVMMKR
jgi:hypothetical protein